MPPPDCAEEFAMWLVARGALNQLLDQVPAANLLLQQKQNAAMAAQMEATAAAFAMATLQGQITTARTYEEQAHQAWQTCRNQ